MNEYSQALAELALLPGLLEERLARSRREVEAERGRREAEIAQVAREHEAVVSRLEAVLERARAEGVEIGQAPNGGGRDDRSGADPVEYARQLVGRLEEALAHFTHTRDALAAEEKKLGAEEHRKAAEERQRREREELRRGEQWEQARQGTIGIALGLAAAAVAGILAGLTGSPGALLVPVLAAAACFAQTITVTSTLPALAARRAGGSMPLLPAAPPRETRMAATGIAATALALCATGTLVTALPGAAPGSLVSGALLLVAAGIAGLAYALIALQHRR